MMSGVFSRASRAQSPSKAGSDSSRSLTRVSIWKPRSPFSSAARTASASARAGSTMGSVARPTKRSGAFATSAATWSFCMRLSSSLRAGSAQ